MPLSPEVYKHLRELLAHLKKQGPEDPAVLYITEATMEKLAQEKRIVFSDK